MDAIERAWVDRVMQLSCAACYRRGIDTPADEYHHLRESAGAGRRAPHLCGIPLCRAHHQGTQEGVHGVGLRKFAQALGADEIDLLGDTLRRLALMLPMETWR